MAWFDPFLTHNPDSPGEVWEVSPMGNNRRHVQPDEGAALAFAGVPFKTISAQWFYSYPVASG